MVQLVVRLLHAREQRSAKRLPLTCQRWWSCNSDGVVITHSTKCNCTDLFCMFLSWFICLCYTWLGHSWWSGWLWYISWRDDGVLRLLTWAE